MGPGGVGPGGGRTRPPLQCVCRKHRQQRAGGPRRIPGVLQVHDHYVLYHLVAMVNLSVFPTRL